MTDKTITLSQQHHQKPDVASKESSKMTLQQGTAFKKDKTTSTKGNGKIMIWMEEERPHIITNLEKQYSFILGNLRMGWSMGLDSTDGQMEGYTKDNGRKVRFLIKEY